MSVLLGATATRDHRIVGALTDGPLSTREIADKLRRENWQAWASANGYEIEWETDAEPVGARLLATSTADSLGLPYAGCTHDIAPRLRSLERRGLVARVQIEGHRPMLWTLARGTEENTE